MLQWVKQSYNHHRHNNIHTYITTTKNTTTLQVAGVQVQCLCQWVERNHPIATPTTITLTYVYHHHQENTTTQCKLPECKSGICASGWKEKHHRRKLQWVKPPRVQVESLCQRLREKHHHRKYTRATCTVWW